MEIIQLSGTEKRLYTLVGPLVMNPNVLKQNNNYPFRTSEHFVWFIALEHKQVIGFIPVECRRKEHIINNYYIAQKDKETMKSLLNQIIESTDDKTDLVAISLVDDAPLFKESGFMVEKTWTLYIKLRKTSQK